MLTWWQVMLSVILGVAVMWSILVVILVVEQRRHPSRVALRELLRIAPDVVRLLARLVRDNAVPVGVRIWLGVLLIYLISPIDLIPDFIPIVGYLDDALIVAIALRYATRHAGAAAIEKLWPGTPAGLSAVLRLAGLSTPGPP